jgi:hypothetical protein
MKALTTLITGVTAILVLGFADAGCSAGPEAPASTRAGDDGATALGKPVPVVFQVPPRATCTIHGAGESGDGQVATLLANDRGLVRAYLTTGAPADAEIPLRLDCTGEDGATTSVPVAVRAGARDTPAAAPDPVERLEPVGTAMPAIEGDPMALSSHEIVARGYPPRPDPARAPQAYAHWARMVSHPFTLVRPGTTERSGVVFGTGVLTGKNAHWSGVRTRLPHIDTSQYYSVAASWQIPSIAAPPASLPVPAGFRWSVLDSQWVGIDDVRDIEQAGTSVGGVSGVVFVDGRSFPYSLVQYGIWTETYPARQFAVPNITPAPGDDVAIGVTIVNADGFTQIDGGRLTAQDNVVLYEVYDFTQNAATFVRNPLPATFTGSQVEFIIERPGTFALPDFGATTMTGCAFSNTVTGSLDMFPPGGGGTPEVPSGALVQLNMVSDTTGDLLATPLLWSTGQPGNSNVTWGWRNYQ